MSKHLLWVVTGLVFLAGCTDPAVNQRIADLEAKVEKLEKAPKAPARPGAPAPADPAAEKAAGELLQAANKAVEAGNYDEAKAKLAELKAKHGATRAARAAGRLEGELAVVGKDAKGLDVEKWHQGNVDISEGKATLMVFWEVWCPHCKREVPKMQEIHDTWGPKGLQVVGLTKQSRDKSDEDVMNFCKENGVGYPTAKEKGDLSEYYGVRGVPAAAVVKGGKVVWRGHPSRINDKMLESWTN